MPGLPAGLAKPPWARTEFGIFPERTFGFRDWVGGRYSLWSPVGLVIALAAGWDKFQAMLDRAWGMDCYFRAGAWRAVCLQFQCGAPNRHFLWKSVHPLLLSVL